MRERKRMRDGERMWVKEEKEMLIVQVGGTGKLLPLMLRKRENERKNERKLEGKKRDRERTRE